MNTTMTVATAIGLPAALAPDFLASVKSCTRQVTGDSRLTTMRPDDRLELASSVRWLHAARLLSDGELVSAWRSRNVVESLTAARHEGEQRLAARVQPKGVEASDFWLHLCFERESLVLRHEWSAYAQHVPVFEPGFPDHWPLRGLVASVATTLGGHCFVPDMMSFADSTYHLSSAAEWLQENDWSMDRVNASLQRDESDDVEFDQEPFRFFENPQGVAAGLILAHEHRQALATVTVERHEFARVLSSIPKRLLKGPLGHWLRIAVDLCERFPKVNPLHKLLHVMDAPLEAGSVLVTSPRMLEACDVEWRSVSESGESPADEISGEPQHAIQVLRGLEQVSQCAALLWQLPTERF